MQRKPVSCGPSTMCTILSAYFNRLQYTAKRSYSQKQNCFGARGSDNTVPLHVRRRIIALVMNSTFHTTHLFVVRRSATWSRRLWPFFGQSRSTILIENQDMNDNRVGAKRQDNRRLSYLLVPAPLLLRLTRVFILIGRGTSRRSRACLRAASAVWIRLWKYCPGIESSKSGRCLTSIQQSVNIITCRITGYESRHRIDAQILVLNSGRAGRSRSGAKLVVPAMPLTRIESDVLGRRFPYLAENI